MNQSDLTKVISCEVVNDGRCLNSNHWAQRTIIKLHTVEHNPTSISNGKINVKRVQYDAVTNYNYNQYVNDRMTEDTTYKEFNKIMIKAAEATASDLLLHIISHGSNLVNMNYYQP